ncbi:MAG: efflux RND transporter periplasmic adaptor subunit [Rhodoplanes sp.]|uniref:efflux RND transporter periplasmic adaptor subunit n=1 Tax=Rhodoplanes sp. TaxID=1968906 RepID=UPI001856BB4D|nr:efflux RND transporter periplasmic adaptor subunit [Rhodoplanes sp.]NVO17380.1 efflux RND transporter periplasmic adaptor subunit [Rhodoplanes sp.]
MRRFEASVIQRVAAAVTVATIALAGALTLAGRSGANTEPAATPGKPAADPRSFLVSDRQWDDLRVETVESRNFVSRLTTEGRIAIDENRATPIFSPYAGRITRLHAQPGEETTRGQLLFTLESPDMVQAQNDFITATAALDKARSQLRLAQTVERRQNDLYAAKAVPLKDWQQAQADLVGAESDMRAAEIALDAVVNRLHLLGRTDQDIEAFRKTGRISPETPIFAPLSGTIVQRKVGPGQYVSVGASDPVFTVGDLSTVWLIANVRESDAAKVRVGQAVTFKVLAFPGRRFAGRLDYVAASVDPASRRLAVRAVIDNADRALKPEMFANVSIAIGEEVSAAAVPRTALVHEGETVRVWVATPSRRLELREIRCGLIDEGVVQVVEGLQPGDRVVTRGSLFIDRAAKARDS